MAKAKTTGRGSGKRTRRVTGTKRAVRPAARAKTATGPSVPLRELLRTGMPRSPKAPRSHDTGPPSPIARRRMKSAYGVKRGATLVQSPPGPREWLGGMKPLKRA